MLRLGNNIAKLKTIRRRSLGDLAARAVTVGLLVVPFLVIALWLTVHHKPGWYHPVELDARGMQQARRQALSLADSISDQMVKRHAFDIVLSDESVTRWIAALDSIHPEAAAQIPPEISDIAVAFDDGVVRIGAQYRGSWHAIINVHLKLGVTEDDSNRKNPLADRHEPVARLWVQLLRTYAGSLPIPSSAVDRIFAAHLEADEFEHEASNNRKERKTNWQSRLVAQSDRRNSLDRQIGSAPSGLDGSPSKSNPTRTEIENRFVWFNGRRPFRILSIQAASGELRLRLEPL